MGVRGLMTFIDEYCPPDCCYEVSIKEIVEKYREETGRQPTMVFDGSSCLSEFYGDLDWACGGQFKEYFNKIHTFINAFKELGVHLVFFFGGSRTDAPGMKDRRITTWPVKLEKVYKMFDHLKSRVPTSELDPSLFRLPTSLGPSYYFKEYFDCEVHKALDGTELAHYARENNCLATVTEDTDFIIHESGKYVLLASKVDLEKMTTVAYDRKRIAEFLKLPLSQLPVFATLAGSNNCALKYDYFKNFHKALCLADEQFWLCEVSFPVLADYVRQLPVGEEIFKVLPAVAQEVFRFLPPVLQKEFNDSKAEFDFNKSESKFAKLLKLHIRHYLPIKPTVKATISCEDSNWNAILQKAKEQHITNEGTTIILKILTGKPFKYSVTTEDFRNTDLPPASRMLRPLRQRSYGILLKEKPENFEPRMVKEWCMEGHDSLKGPYFVKPIPPSPLDHHPGLLVLWGEDRSDETQYFRWQLFSHAISQRLNHSDLLTMPEDYLTLPTSTLFYLVEHNVLEPQEVNALLATIITLPLVPLEYLNTLSVDPVNLRAVQIASIFMRSMVTIVRLLSICGYPLTRSRAFAHPYFDGKLFQEKYQKAKKGATYKDLCGNQEKAENLFLHVREILAKADNTDSNGAT